MAVFVFVAGKADLQAGHDLITSSSDNTYLAKSFVNKEKIKRTRPADFISPVAITAPSISGLRVPSWPLIGRR